MKYKIRKHSKFFQLCESVDFDRISDTDIYAATIDGVDILISVPDKMKLFDPIIKESGFDKTDMLQLLLYYHANRRRGDTVSSILEAWLKTKTL